MMKKTFALLVLANIVPLVASAQMRPSTRQVCTSRCLRIDFAENPKIILYKEKIKQIQAKKQVETDPQKRKALEEDEALETEKRDDLVENMCHHICRNNPEG